MAYPISLFRFAIIGACHCLARPPYGDGELGLGPRVGADEALLLAGAPLPAPAPGLLLAVVGTLLPGRHPVPVLGTNTTMQHRVILRTPILILICSSSKSSW